jgi:type VI secretion system protein ImpB
MENFGVKLNYRVPNKIVDDPNAVMDINIDAKSTKAFAPDNVLQNTASLRKVLELKQALIALKGPLGNTPAMRRQIKDIFNNEKRRQALKTELESSGSTFPMGRQLQHKKED